MSDLLEATAASLGEALRRRGRRDWLVAVRAAQRGEAGAERRTIGRATVRLTVHEDTATGRGSGWIEAPLAGLAPEALIDAALQRARAAAGPPWRAPPPAGPARVELADPALGVGAVDVLAAEVLADARAAGGAATIAGARGVVERAQHALRTSGGLALAWAETRAEVTGRVVDGGAAAPVAVAARRRGDLALAAVLAEATRGAAGRAAASPLATGRYPVVLDAAACVDGLGALGPWSLLVAAADGARARAGLAAYAPGDELAPGAATSPSPLTVTSDGARAFGLSAAPLGDDGAPVRRFALVERGRAGALALDQREAALRGVAPNGGVRELVVAPGDVARADLLVPGTLEILAARWLALDVGSGLALAEVELARWHAPGGPRWVRGGWLRGDALAWLAGARRSREVTSRGRYHGPTALALGEALVEA